MNSTVLKAVFKRDFVSYFSSPTGYVFICVFAVLSGLATFWSPDFFTRGLANLDQLTRWLPFIMLVFIPAITMSIWAEERRQGTDELLLTIPASDFDVVLGKYLAGVAIFTVSLLFSAFSIFVVFKYGLGDPDIGLYLSTFVGYWFIGIAMIAVGMVASFLTDNLTVGFILGTLFNLPLAILGVADWIFKDFPAIAQGLRRWSALEQFRDFERGVLSLGGMIYFVSIAAVMVYLSMVLISRRHWRSREDGPGLGLHYLVRTLCLILAAAGLTVFIQNHNWLRADVTSENLNSLSPETVKLVSALRDDDKVDPITIDAYVSPEVPNEYASTKANLLSTLEELKALGGDKISVVMHEIPNFGPEAEKAEKNFGITPREYRPADGGKQVDFFLGVAFTSGLKKVKVPFVNTGIPVEYELARSILTVSQPKLKKLGVVNTGFPFLNDIEQAEPSQYAMFNELKKQYDMTLVDAHEPIDEKYDALLAMQPSMLSPAELDHFVDAVRKGMPTAIFEDPYPFFFPESMVVGTGEDRQSNAGPMAAFGGGQRIPATDTSQLWRLLQVSMNPNNIVWQDWEPEFSVIGFQEPQWAFIDSGNGAAQPFNEKDPITSGLNQVLLIFSGALNHDDDSSDGSAALEFEPLLTTGKANSGVSSRQVLRMARMNPLAAEQDYVATQQSYILAAHITGKPAKQEAVLEEELSDENDPADRVEEEADKKAAEKLLNVVLVADIDWTIPSFFDIREQGIEGFLPATQNVTLVLNVLDSLSGDDRFLNIRKRTRPYKRLKDIDAARLKYRKQARDEENEFVKEIKKKISDTTASYEEKLEKINNNKNLSRVQKQQRLEQFENREGRVLQASIKALQTEQKQKTKKIDNEMDREIEAVQLKYKLLGLSIPLIPPLLLAVAVFFHRREQERQGVSRERLR